METGLNKIELVGTILDELEFSHSINGEDFYTTRISVLRSSRAVDNLILCISGRLIINSSTLLNKVVFIKGQIRTYNYKSDEDQDSSHIALKTYVLVDDLEILDEDIESEDDYYDENNVKLSGYICKKSNPRVTPLGRVICDCILAVNRNYGKSDYIPCIFWGKNAKYMEVVDIGQKMDLTGRLQSRSYLKNGEEKVAYEVSVNALWAE